MTSHAHAGQDRHACAEPRISADLDRLAGQNIQIIGVMVVGKQLDIGGDAGMIADGDAPRAMASRLELTKTPLPIFSISSAAPESGGAMVLPAPRLSPSSSRSRALYSSENGRV